MFNNGCNISAARFDPTSLFSSSYHIYFVLFVNGLIDSLISLSLDERIYIDVVHFIKWEYSSHVLNRFRDTECIIEN